MGKPYDSELAQLRGTYEWARSIEIGPLADVIRRATALPLVAIGSGGSFAAAEFATALHREASSGAPASAHTPLDASATLRDLRRFAVLMSTAGGANPDVLGSFRVLASREPKTLIVLCLRRHTPLARRAARFPFVDFFEYDLPTGHDGFLATSSLLAAMVFLARAYAAARGMRSELPARWGTLMPTNAVADLDRSLAPAWARQTIIVLHGPHTRAAAVDLESRFTEAALGNLWTADYRQFAHGRHHWLAKNAKTSAVLALVTAADKTLASKTLALIPSGTPITRVEVPLVGSAAAVSAVVRGMYIARSAGRARGIDPGRPGVPGFGRRIYRLNAFAESARTRPDAETLAIERKTGLSMLEHHAAGTSRYWHDAYRKFLNRLDTAAFTGVVIDYDGTLCSAQDRLTGLRQDVADDIARLLQARAHIGIATGRGKSVRKELRALLPRRLWDRVIVGYYNGGDIGCLADDSHPNGAQETCEALKPVTNALRAQPILKRFAEVELRLPQIKITITRDTFQTWACDMIGEIVRNAKISGLGLVHSAHSIDILAPGVTKRSVIKALVAQRAATHFPGPILCIGDRGRYPGNDHDLLTGPFALTVDEASPDPMTCWNLAPAGFRNVAATRYYLSQLRPSRTGLRFGGTLRARR